MNKLYSDSYGEVEDLAYFSEIIFKDQEEREWEQYKHLRLKYKDKIEAEEREKNNGQG